MTPPHDGKRNGDSSIPAGSGEEAMGPFDPSRSGFAHAGLPEGPAPVTSAKVGRSVPLLVSRAKAGSDLPVGRILQGLRGTNVTIAYQDRDLVYSWIANPPAGFEGVAGQRDEDILPAAAAELLTREKLRCLKSGKGTEVTLDVGEGTPQWFDIWLEPDMGEGGSVEGVIVVGIEVTERVGREERLRVLLREVSHRSRNLLAIVQSIASQTVRTAKPGRFLDRFNERLQSLAHTLDLVTLREWEGATLHQLVSRQSSPFRPSSGAIEIGGPDPVLTPNAALHLGLAVQELASNALKHGAWSQPDGTIEARTRMAEDGATLIFEWKEAAEGTVFESTGSFGSRTLMSIVPASLSGEASMISRSDGFTYRLSVPAANFDG